MSPASPYDRILSTAGELFYGEGIRATGVDTIIARAEVAKATFYKHFPSKDDLILAYVETQSAQLSGAIAARLDAMKGGPKAKLLGVFDVIRDLASDDDFRGCRFIRATAELDREHPARKAALAHKTKLRNRLEALAKDAGLPRPASIGAQLALLVDGALVKTWMYGDLAGVRDAKAIAKTLLS